MTDPDESRLQSAQRQLSSDQGEVLLDLALESVATGLLHGRPARPARDLLIGPLAVHGACFVTLERGAALLGCIGSLQAHRALVEDVAGNAFAAAFQDPRLPAVTVEDYTVMAVEISVLGTPTPLSAHSVREVVSLVESGQDGLVVESPGHRATFLPAVWRRVPDPEEFLHLLWRKAWLTPGTWPSGTTVSTYRVRELSRSGPRPLPAP